MNSNFFMQSKSTLCQQRKPVHLSLCFAPMCALLFGRSLSFGGSAVSPSHRLMSHVMLVLGFRV